ncbi:hypothetical protein ABTZ58_03635 [Streptomyces sp. NPDC094143]|uniref:hypothetical protein n=1 Tax=unclassified Streptomyces TaxID=2593676 RepID=UPI00331AABC0
MELDLRGELFIGGQWVDATGQILQRQALVHERGRQDQGARVDPSTCRPLLNNTDGRFSPDNPMGPYYGQFGRNTPFRLSLRSGPTFLEIPEGGGDASTPDVAALDITGDIDVRVDLTLLNWLQPLPGTTGIFDLFAKYSGSGRSWLLGTLNDTVLFRWSQDGTNILNAQSVPLPIPASGRLALRATLDVDNGAGGRTITFYTAPTMAGPWTQLGSPVVQAGTTSIANTTAPLKVGDATDFVYTEALGRVHKAEVRNGINGPLVAAPDFTAQAPGVTSFVDSAGRTWTVNGGASITNRHTRLVHELAAYPTRWHPSGAHVWVEAQTAGILRRLGRGTKALDSTLRRRIPSYGPLAYWPMEDGQTATRAASPIAGVRPLSLSRVDWASADSLPSSNPLPVLASGGGELAMMYGRIPAPATAQTSWQVQWIYRLDQANTTLNTYMRILSTGTVREWYIQQRDVQIRIIGKDDDGANVFSNEFSTGPDLFGQWIQVRFEVNQDGGNVDWQIIFTDVGGDAGAASGTFAGTVGRPTAVASPPDGYSSNLDGLALGHISAWAPWVGGSGFTAYEGAIEAWTGETAGERMRRLATEESLPLTVCGVVAEQERVGPQRPDALLTLLQEAADADGGILYEDRERPALRYRDRAGMYNQTPSLVLDYTAPGLAPPLEPTGDDDATANDVTVSRVGGSSARAVLEEGALSVQAPPDGVGPYDTSVTLNLHSDEQTEPQAYWRLHLGTYEGRRYPQVHVMVHRAPELAEQILATDVGNKIVIQNPPRWLAPGDIELLVQGYEETWASEFQWEIVFNCTPAEPWTVAVVGDEELGRVDSDRTVLASAVTDSATTLITHVPPNGLIVERQPWIYSDGPNTDYPNLPGEFPFDVALGGEVVRATGIEPAVWDTFGRTVANAWGTANSGQAWTVLGAAADYAVGSGYASATLPTTGIAHLGLLPAPSADVDLIVDVAVSVLPTGASLFTGPIARALDNNNLYQCRIEVTTAAAVVMSLRKRVTGTETQLGAFTAPFTAVAGTFYRVRMQLSGSALKAKLWPVTADEPGNWHLQVTDTSLTAANQIGIRGFSNTGNTNVSPQLRFDNFHLRTPQKWTVQRSINQIVKAHSAGTLVSLAKPAVVAL